MRTRTFFDRAWPQSHINHNVIYLQVYQFSHKSIRPVLKVETTSDDRYTPIEGQYFHYQKPSVDTTYPVPQISNHDLYPHHHHPNIVHLPLHRPLLLPNPRLKQNPFPLRSHHYQSFNGKGMHSAHVSVVVI